MDGNTLCSIGDLARRTGLTVKTIRFYSDRGIVTPTDRSPAGHRLYDTDAVARLRLVRTLRDLGLDLPTIRKVVDKELALTEVAAAHAEALAVQISVLRLRRAVLTAVATRASTAEETELMHHLAQLSEEQRRRLTGEFLDAVFGGPRTAHATAGVRRSLTPELPDDPEADQVQAWVELAELLLDPEFRTTMRRLVEDQTADMARSGSTGPRRDLMATVRDHAASALSAGVDPASPDAEPVVAAFTADCAHLLGRPDDLELRRRLSARLESVNDPRRERYVRLLAVINGWPVPESLTPVLDWCVEALRARTPR
ncbi:MerR family transcriptional regulator [Streptomyces sp. NPDC054884]|uniref:MerR family transcriptional regulator n=1 Tax=Streptomyces sp. ME08-AFT2 TaxID=3028683 RepID=UPI0029BF2156|nr:MerR family transcriptional regulator [Streptomyces sp. ME08-AFT2]MDX3310523.1 MerR family transcriptional regulator [Streptomyces sp. ME08-AFT2]